MWTYFENCVLASVSQLSCTTAPPQRLRPQEWKPPGEAPPEGRALLHQHRGIQFLLGTPPRGAIGCEYLLHWMVAKQPLIHTTPKKSTGHPGSNSLALGVKAKKEKQIRRFANQAFARCHPEAGRTCNRRGCTKQEEKNE